MEFLIIFALTLVNGFFALCEIAIVSLKRNKIEHLASQGSVRAKIILDLLDNPENFLSSIQVGITLIGVVAGAYGGASLTDNMALFLADLPLSAEYIRNISMVTVIGGITFFTIVVGELVPKTIAMNHPERIAMTCVPIIKYFTMLTYPFVRLLSLSTKVILKTFRIKDSGVEHISEEELRFMLKSAGKQGVLEKEESVVHQNLFSFTDQTANSLMTHSTEVEWIDSLEPKEKIFDQLKDSVHSRFIVSEGELNKVKGILHIKDFFEEYDNDDFSVRNVIRKPIFITPGTPAFRVLNLFKAKKEYMGIVIDEYGGVDGVITLHDLFEAIIGDLPDEDEGTEPNIVKRKDGSYLLNGQTLIYEINQYFQREVIEDKNNLYTTVSGLIMHHLREIPVTGQTLIVEGWIFEIMDMDDMRVDKVLMTRKDPDGDTQ